jgi:hypothetical protein
LTDSDDGEEKAFLLERPFYSLDSRWSAAVAVGNGDSIQGVYRLGHRVAEYRRETQSADLRFGWSSGLRDGWARRWTAGLRHDEARYLEVPDAVPPAALPDERDLNYPYIRYEAIQDDFETAQNLDLIARTEDLQFGMRYALELGWAAAAYGSDRDAALLRAELSRGFRMGVGRSLFIATELAGRIENGSARDALLSGQLRYFRQTSRRTTFFASLTGAAGRELDAEHEPSLGGDNGMRGYPLRYQTGSSRVLLTVEQRLYTKYTLWKLAWIGGAVFFDMGRTWGESAFGPTNSLGMLKDVGFGLRLGNMRSGLGNVLHLDVAFPLDGDPSISSVQFLVQTKRTF